MTTPVTGLVEVVGVGRIRRHGEGEYEVCLVEDYVTTPIIKEAVSKGRVLYAVVVLPDGGGGIQIHNRPFLDRGRLCLNLHTRYNSVWEGLWVAGKPVLIKFALRP